MKHLIKLLIVCLMMLTGCQNNENDEFHKIQLIDTDFTYEVNDTSLHVKANDFIDSMESHIRITYNNQTETFYSYGLYASSFLIDDRYLVVQLFQDNDYRTLNVYDINEMKLTQELGNAECINLESKMNEFTMVSRIDALSSYYVMTTYSFHEGQFEKNCNEYKVSDERPIILTTIKDLPVKQDGKETIIEKGNTVQIIATDEDSYVVVLCQDQEYTIEYERRDYSIFIDGISEYEYFKELYYAG